MLFALAAAAVLACGIAVSIRLEPRVQRWYVDRARRRWTRAVLVVVGANLLVLAGWFLVAVAATVVGRHADRPWVAVLTVPACLLALPWALVHIPGTPRWGPASAGSQLRRAGASTGVARAVALTGIPFGFLGIGIVTGALLATFAA